MYNSQYFPILPIYNSTYPYPSDVHSCFKAAVLECSTNLKLPVPLVCLTALNSIAAVLQGLVDVEIKPGSSLPVSLYSLITVPSGGGKNKIIQRFKRPIEKFEDDQVKAYEAEFKIYEVKRETWLRQRKALLKNKATVLDDEALVKSLIAHNVNEPITPKKFRMIFEDTTPEALLQSLGYTVDNAWLVTSEGGIVLSQHSMKNMPALNQLFSGDRITIDRKTSGSYVLEDVRASILIMSQPGIFNDFIKRNGATARESGFFARCLVLEVPPSDVGQFEDDQVLIWQSLEQFHLKIRRFLAMSVSGISRSIVSFSPEAGRRWIAIKNAIVEEVRAGGRFNDFPDLAARTPENIARISALLHFFEEQNGDISVETLDYACRLCFWHVDQFRHMFSERSTVEDDAKLLYDWLCRRLNSNLPAYPKNYIRQACPNPLRKDGRFDAAFDLLVLRHYLTIKFFGNGAQGVIFNPNGNVY